MSSTYPTRPRQSNTTTRGRGQGNSTRPSPGRNSRGRVRGAGPAPRFPSRSMEDQHARHADYGPSGSSSSESRSTLEQRGQYAGGYTVFAPNQERRQQINEMASRETQAYQSFKDSNRQKSYSYVGTVGGGELTQNQARNRQAHAVRAQKFNRQTRQSELREERRRAEDQEIEARRMEARRKSEQNRVRADRMAPADEVRRKREAFLQQLEAQSSPTKGSTSGL